ncbi:hypothetical protein Tdes44962_MAKER04948 [Teratosphaeria destructans]|uniref:Uncharacterized protein n=1 Tax=Teratosphaeria destructans TaxID=418781 RepID=A0A9W7SLU8_9PEZI|nr:hypothetical protein Tdes44962_MAKER04948 [Teratosphaeria destructans]
MDWTGGARRRFAAGKNNATLQKQKAHFAKARATLHNSSRSQRNFQPDYSSVTSRHRNALANGRRHDRPHVRSRPSEQAASKHSRTRPSRVEASSPGVAHSEASSPCTGPPYSGSTGDGESFVPPARRDAIPQPLIDEELLRANKQRLLARTDWLGLSKKRPAPAIRFPSASDRDQVGKRRKIRKSHHRSKAAGPRARTPLFEEHIPNGNAYMSGGLPAQDFDIRIGTEALATQTAPSQHSQPSRHTSMRQPSTELGPLSEEPMLLGDDGDSCDLGGALTEPAPSVRATMNDVSHLTEQYHFTPFHDPGAVRLSYHSHMVADIDIARVDSISSTALQDQDHVNVDHSIEPSHAASNVHGNGIDIDDQLQPLGNYSREHTAKEYAIRSPRDVTFDRASSHLEFSSEMVAPATDHAHEENLWRTTVGVQHELSSHASVAALKSSSMHQTNSESDNRAAAAVERARIDQALPLPSTPKGRGTQVTCSIVGAEDTLDSVTDSSLPASLKLYDRLARLPAHATKTKTWEADETNALWRDFCRVNDYDSESSEQPASSEGSDPEAVRLATDTSAIEGSISGLDTSVKATASKAGSGRFSSDLRSQALEEPENDELEDNRRSTSHHRARPAMPDHRWSKVQAAAQPFGRRRTANLQRIDDTTDLPTRSMNNTLERSKLKRRNVYVHDIATDSTVCS